MSSWIRRYISVTRSTRQTTRGIFSFSMNGANRNTPAASQSNVCPENSDNEILSDKAGTSAPFWVRPSFSFVRRGSLENPASARIRSTVRTEISIPSSERSWGPHRQRDCARASCRSWTGLPHQYVGACHLLEAAR